jgi:hypothetical protein
MLSISRIVCLVVIVAAGAVATSELFAAESARDRETPAAQSSKAELSVKRRESTELSGAAKSALRASHAAKTAKERDTAARDLVQVFVELQDDQSLASSTRNNLQQQVRHRLLAIETGLRSAINSAESRRKNVDAEKTDTDAKDKPQTNRPATIEIKDRPPVLAQQMAPPVAPGVVPPRVNNQPNGGQPPDDYGPELLELIQRVIRPSSWDVNGGASSGFYYQPLHALVISAPEEMHEEIGGVVGGLRK